MGERELRRRLHTRPPSVSDSLALGAVADSVCFCRAWRREYLVVRRNHVAKERRAGQTDRQIQSYPTPLRPDRVVSSNQRPPKRAPTRDSLYCVTTYVTNLGASGRPRTEGYIGRVCAVCPSPLFSAYFELFFCWCCCLSCVFVIVRRVRERKRYCGTGSYFKTTTDRDLERERTCLRLEKGKRYTYRQHGRRTL
jgi:hypothetical protein